MAITGTTRLPYTEDILLLIMFTSDNKTYWLIWTLLILISLAYFSHKLWFDNDKTVFMPGELSNGHHQIGMSCDSCHKNAYDNQDQILESCIECHGDNRQKPFDSHPRSKFKDPRNADRLVKINALNCISCHSEHQPAITQKNGLTQARDFCVHCHAGIADERPSHEGMAFDTCASAGCHNYHNNRALYTDFLIKHRDEPELLSSRTLPKREFADVLDEVANYPHDRYPVQALSLSDIDKPLTVETSDQIKQDWARSAHAKMGANCSACHIPLNEDGGAANWTNQPELNACTQCHGAEVKHFKRGKHGMRLQVGLPAMTPALARLPMKAESHGTELQCNSCHPAHSYDLVDAAVEQCLSCHNDEHSLAYKQSAHYAAWQQEQSGQLPAGSGVSCASCHMPRASYDVSEWLNRIMVQHNQSASLKPNTKMLRPVCMQCHGLEFSIDALADDKLINNNFQGKPTLHIQSMDMAKREHLRHSTGEQSDD